MRHHLPRFAAVSTVAALLASAAPALADAYSDGTASYAAGNFAKAKAQFMKAIAAKPKSWQAHYQLANTYVQLKEAGNAKTSYTKCISLAPPPDIKANCTSAISYIAGNPALTAPAVPAARPKRQSQAHTSSSGAGTADDDSDDGGNGAPNSVEARRAAVLQEGEAEIARMREHENEKLKDAEAGGNQRYITHDGQEVMGLTPEDKAAMEKEIERKAAEIRDRYKRKAASIR